MQSVFTKVKDLRMHARVIDNRAQTAAPTVVLVHGLGVSSRYMIPTAERLADIARVYALDLPGFGKSGRTPQALAVPELADYLNVWMEAIGIERAMLVGNSFGAQIIVDLAARYPARVQSAALIAPTIDQNARGFFRQLGRLLLDAPREPLSLLPIVMGDYFTAGLSRTARTLLHALADPIEAKLPHIKTPTLVIRGERDPIVSQQWAEEVARLLPSARMEIIPRVAHAVNYSSPDELRRLLLPLLQNENAID
jgi:pimeloyl-ACP methyl ester carboxylesterase